MRELLDRLLQVGEDGLQAAVASESRQQLTELFYFIVYNHPLPSDQAATCFGLVGGLSRVYSGDILGCFDKELAACPDQGSFNRRNLLGLCYVLMHNNSSDTIQDLLGAMPRRNTLRAILNVMIPAGELRVLREIYRRFGQEIFRGAMAQSSKGLISMELNKVLHTVCAPPPAVPDQLVPASSVATTMSQAPTIFVALPNSSSAAVTATSAVLSVVTSRSLAHDNSSCGEGANVNNSSYGRFPFSGGANSTAVSAVRTVSTSVDSLGGRRSMNGGDSDASYISLRVNDDFADLTHSLLGPDRNTPGQSIRLDRPYNFTCCLCMLVFFVASGLMAYAVATRYLYANSEEAPDVLARQNADRINTTVSLIALLAVTMFLVVCCRTRLGQCILTCGGGCNIANTLEDRLQSFWRRIIRCIHYGSTNPDAHLNDNDNDSEIRLPGFGSDRVFRSGSLSESSRGSYGSTVSL